MEQCCNYISTKMQCPRAAVWKRYYPGADPDHVCDQHKKEWEALAAALGIKIPFERIGRPDW